MVKRLELCTEQGAGSQVETVEERQQGMVLKGRAWPEHPGEAVVSPEQGQQPTQLSPLHFSNCPHDQKVAMDNKKPFSSRALAAD